MFCNVNAKKILFLFVAQLILFSLGLATSARAAEPIQACRNGATRGCAIKGMPGQQYCDGGVWSACAPLPPTLPNPILELTGKEDYQANGQNWTRYKLAVKNHAAYPNAMFAPAPNLPPCGANKNSSRTWVNIYHYVALKTPPQYIYGFCALSSSNDLVNLWFASPAGKAPPSPVIVVLEDRQTKKNYISNPAMIAPNATPRIQCGFNDKTHMGECSCTGDAECNEMFTNYCKEGGASGCDTGTGKCTCEMKL